MIMILLQDDFDFGFNMNTHHEVYERHEKRSRGQHCKTVTQKNGNTVTTYTHCS